MFPFLFEVETTVSGSDEVVFAAHSGLRAKKITEPGSVSDDLQTETENVNRL